MWSFIKYPPPPPKKKNITRSWDEYRLTPGATNYITTPKNIITLTGIKQWVIAQSTHLKSQLERRNGRNAWLSYELYIYVRCVCFIILLFFLLFSSLMKEPRMNDVTLARSILFWVVWRFFKKWKLSPDTKDTGWLGWNSTFIVTVRNAILGLNFRWGTNVFKRNQCYLGRWINYTHPFP